MGFLNLLLGMEWCGMAMVGWLVGYGYVCCINWKSLRYFTWISDTIECILFASNNRSIERCFRCYTRSIAAATFSVMISDISQIMWFCESFYQTEAKKQLSAVFYLIVMSSFEHVPIGIKFCWSIDICDVCVLCIQFQRENFLTIEKYTNSTT